MATLSSDDNSGIDLSAFNLQTITSGSPATPADMTSTLYRLPNAEFDGFGFTYTGNSLTDGTINRIVILSAGQDAYEITGLLLPVADVDKFLSNGNDSQGFLGEVFSGADVLDGSTSNDHLLGFGGNDTLEGNEGNDTLEGGAGNDLLDGGTGDDSMDGGAGNDLYLVDSAKDSAKDSGPGTDVDTVQSTVDYTIDASIENLTLLDTATKGTGNASNNVLTGDDVNNTLDGAAGADTMQGGKGDDTYIVDNLGDTVIESKGQGTDLVMSSVTFTLGDNVENLTLTGSDNNNGTGNALANVITGNAGNNQLQGLGGADTIVGGDGNDTIDGGAGNDRMVGGLGDDLFIVDSVLDTVIENGGEGVDTVESAVSFTITKTAVVEILELTGILDINGTGDQFSNLIIGNVGKNILNGGGGVDTLQGGDGDDTYIVDNAKDQVIELSGAGTGHDVVQSSASFSLATNGANVEDLILTGTAAIDGTGNDLANKLTGNAANNKLDGGLGDDTMIGGAGDDAYVVDSAKDVISDSSGTGDEVFFTGKDLSLVKLYTNIEHYNFSLLDVGAGPVNFTGTTAANRITGTALNDTLVGGTGNDTLIGGDGTDSLNGGAGNDRLDGGAGDDTMDGGAGNDTYVIDVYTDKIVETGKDTGDTVETAVAGLHIDLNQASNGQPLFAGIENVTFTGTEDLNATGTAAKNVLTGNAGDNLLIGGDGNDTLIGGAGNDTLAGDDSLGGGKGSDSMAGGTGDDQYFVNSTADKIFEDKDAGNDLVRSTISYILGANLETLVLLGSADINGTGNELANDLRGTDGKNILDGKAGADTLQGFGGDDTYIVDSKDDLIVEAVNGGHDTVKSSTTYSLAITGVNVEDLVLTGGFNIDGTGNDGANVLTGNTANNKLDGGLGADTMKGGAGDDTYTVDNIKDVVSETGGSGLHDTVIFQLTDPADQLAAQKLISGVENYDFSKFTIAVNFAGDGAGNAITGGVIGDTLAGNAGNDTLDGGTGADILTGGTGNDTFVIDTLADQIIELKGGGTDTVVSLLPDYVLSEPTPTFNVENLTIGDVSDANASGNSQANLIRGNDGDNELKGLAGNDTIFAGDGDDTLDGGTGNDSLLGGFGSDTYILDSKSDRVVEAPGLGVHDMVIAPFDYTLGANVEDLTLVGAAKIGIGNDLDNNIFGDAQDNTLEGKGGIDHYEGGAGNDTYIIRSIAETIVEQPNEGNDTVKTSWKEYHLPNEVENLFFTVGFHNFGTGNASDNLIVGNVVSDTLQGGAGDDTLDGGAGGDSLTGGTGNDTYIVDNALDVVQEFGGGGGIDTIQAKISIDLANYQAPGSIDVIENVTLTGGSALSATGNALANHLIGNSGANKLIGNGGDDTLDGGAGADSLDGGTGLNQITGGAGNDHINVGNGDDTVFYTSKLDGKDIIDNFDGDTTGGAGHDVLNLDALFDNLGIATDDRETRVHIAPVAGGVDVSVDISPLHNGSSILAVATLHTTDTITVGEDVVVGTA